MIIQKLFGFLENHILKIGVIIISVLFALSSFFQFFVNKYNISSIIQIEWMINFYKWIKSDDYKELINIIDGFAVVVGGLSFFTNEWIKKDSENIVYMVIVVISLISSHIFGIFNLHIISFSLSVAAILMTLFPLLFLINESLINSKRRNLNRNIPKIKK